MNHALVLHLIKKDWYLSRMLLVLSALAGAASVGILYLRTEVGGFVGLSSAAIVLVMVAILLPMNTIVNERKRQNLAFVMSLPISAMDYTLAKILANLSAFLVVWLVVTFAVIGTLANTGVFGGLIPLTLAAALAPFVAFSLLLAVSLVVESEFWAIVTMSACNVSYTFLWFFAIRIPSVREDLRSPVPIWSDTLLWILAVEITAIVLALGLAIYFQSRKRNFI